MQNMHPEKLLRTTPRGNLSFRGASAIEMHYLKEHISTIHFFDQDRKWAHTYRAP